MRNLIRARRVAAGFTLAELMIAIAVLGIILGIAVPSMQSFILNQRVRSASFDLTSDFLFARSEATKRNANVTIAANGGSWQNGWIVSAGGVTLKQRDIIRDLVAVRRVSNTCQNGHDCDHDHDLYERKPAVRGDAQFLPVPLEVSFVHVLPFSVSARFRHTASLPALCTRTYSSLGLQASCHACQAYPGYVLRLPKMAPGLFRTGVLREM